VIRGEQSLPVLKFVLGGVREVVSGAGFKLPVSFQIVEVGVESNLPKSHDHSQVLQALDLAIKEGRTVGEFLRQRFVVGRSAASGGCDVQILECEAVLAIDCVRLARESKLVENRIHEVAGGIAGERASRAIRAVCAGREAEHEHMRIRIAEARYRFSPIIVIAISTALFAGNSLAISHETRALRAGDHLAIEDGKPGRKFEWWFSQDDRVGSRLILDETAQGAPWERWLRADYRGRFCSEPHEKGLESGLDSQGPTHLSADSGKP
jgi:hypothetical protein